MRKSSEKARTGFMIKPATKNKSELTRMATRINAKKNSRTFAWYLRLFASIALLFTWAFMTQATSFTINPVVMDEKAKARDILKEFITITNNTQSKLDIYTFVNNIAVREGKQEFMDPSRADREVSLANWIEISRGVLELQAGEKKEIPFEINVFLRAKPGMYHALISFAEGSTRDEAEKNISSAPSVTVNLEVREDIKEKLQLKKFIPDKIFFSRLPASFTYEIENIGNRPVSPVGEIRIYDRRGEEVASITVNDTNSAVEPQSALRLANTWNKAPTSTTLLASILPLGGRFGRYKAVLDLEYGALQRGTLQDTVFFWVIPLWSIVMFFGAGAAMVIMLALWWYNRYTKKHETEYETTRKVIDLRPSSKLSKSDFNSQFPG